MAPRKAPPSAWSKVQPVPVFSFGLKGNTCEWHPTIIATPHWRRPIAICVAAAALSYPARDCGLLQQPIPGDRMDTLSMNCVSLAAHRAHHVSQTAHAAPMDAARSAVAYSRLSERVSGNALRLLRR